MELQIAYGPYSDAGNEAGPRVLRSIPGCVLGPGHNCVILGPDRQTSILFTMPGIPTWRCADVLGQTDLDGGWPAAQDPPGRRKLLSAEVMCERVDETGCASTMSNSAYSF